MSIAHVQDASNSASSSSASVTLSATGAGNALVMPGRIFSSGSSGYPSAISGGGSWTFPTADHNAAPPADSFGGGTGSSCFVCYILSATSVTSVTLTESGASGPYTEPSVGEFSGVGSAGPGGTSSGSSSTPSMPGLSYSNGDLVVAIAYPSNGTNFSGVPSGFTAFAAAGASDNVNWACWQVMSGSGTLSASWPGSGVPSWIVSAQVFHASGGGTPHTATASLTVTPSFSAGRTRGKYRTGLLPLVPSFSALRTMAHVRHGSLAVTPSFLAVPSGGAVKIQQGSWWQLDSVLKERAEYANYYRSIPPVACPNDGEPLREGPPQQPGVLYCRFDGWQYPRDFDPDIHSGM